MVSVTSGAYVNKERSCILRGYDNQLPDTYAAPRKNQPYCEFWIADTNGVVRPDSFDYALGQSFLWPYGSVQVLLGCQWVSRRKFV